MCGIVGYIGSKSAAPVLINGLKRLEYRGYDSSGLVVLNAKDSFYERAVGRVVNLEKAIKKDSLKDLTLGIAHTRWATHGKPSKENAHPHTDCTGSFWLVHNGIIENYQTLREKLIKSGHKFKSETDTETLVHLIEAEFEKSQDLFEAVRSALKLVRGTYGIAVVSKHEPGKIIAARNSSPLIIGVSDKENLVASDVSAVINFTKDVIYLNDEEIAEVTKDGYRIESVNGTGALERSPEKVDWDIEAVKKGGHKHFMHKEIFEAPEVIVNSTRGRILSEQGLVKLGGIEGFKEELRDVKRIIITACGTASYAGLVGEYMLEEYAGIPTEVDIASELRYRKPVFEKGTLLLAISQSGETADTIAAIHEAKEKGLLTMGIVNVVGSSIARMTDFGIYNHAGPEISVASTKAFISQLTVLSLFSIFLGRQRSMSLTMGKRIGNEIQKLPKLVEKVLEQEKKIQRIAKKYYKAEKFLCLGRKYNAPIANEAALKLKEICYIQAEGMSAGEIKHGSIALISKDLPTLVIAPKDSVYEKTRSNIEEIKARGGPVIAIATKGDKNLKSFCDDIIYIPKTLEMLTPILSTIPTYLLSYYISKLRGNDMDKPRNLAKSVTVE